MRTAAHRTTSLFHYTNDSRRLGLYNIGALAGIFSRRMLTDIAICADIAIVVFLGYTIKYLYLGVHLNDPPRFLAYTTCIVLVAVPLYAGLRRQVFYDKFGQEIAGSGVWRGFFSLWLTLCFSFAFALFAFFIIKETEFLSRVWFSTWFLASYCSLVCTQIFWRVSIRRLLAAGYFRRNVILVGLGAPLREASERLRRSAVAIVAIYNLESKRLASPPRRACSDLASFLDEIVGRCRSQEIGDILVAMPSEEPRKLAYVLKHLRLLPVNVNVLPDFGGHLVRFENICEFGDVRALAVQRAPISGWGVLLKKTEDYAIASLALIIFLPAMLLIALAIKLESPGPILFRQRRHGFNNDVIEVLKFRSMTVLEDDATIRQASRNDQRVTRVGRLLRRTSLDELPQLINVLRGDMSLVGPRPHAVAHNDYYSKLLENYTTRHRVKPGITGLAQINGFRGETADRAQMRERVKFDLQYIDYWSIWLDLKILAMTPLYGFVSRNAY